jgi:hypothetical protein
VQQQEFVSFESALAFYLKTLNDIKTERVDLIADATGQYHDSLKDFAKWLRTPDN